MLLKHHVFKQKNHEELLAIQLDNSHVDHAQGCPLFVPGDGVDTLHQYADRAQVDLAETGILYVDHNQGCPLFVPGDGVDTVHQYADRTQVDLADTGMAKCNVHL